MFTQCTSSDEFGFQADMLLYRDFLKTWEDGTFSTSHPVFGLVRNSSYLLCHQFNRQNDADDLVQNGFMLLSRGQYRGDCKLSTYITTILKNEVRSMWRQAGAGKGEELT